jgi:subtilase family serine protease
VTTAGFRRLLGAGATIVALTLAPAAARAATSPQTAPGRDGAAHVGTAPAGRTLSLELPLAHPGAALARFATAVSTPGSPRFGDYESVAALSRRFGASPAARRQVVRYLTGHGATNVKIDATGLFADATLRVGTAQHLFGADLGRFHADATRTAPAENFIAPTRAAHVPAALRGAVTGVVGLDTRPLVRSAPARASAAQRHALTSAAATPPPAPVSSAYPTRTGTPAGCAAALAKPGFTPNQYLTAYGYDPLHAAGLNGSGERVALIEIDGFQASDVQAFAKCFDLPTPQINAFGVGINKALPAGAEATLDLELLDAAAPRLKAVDVYESQPIASQVLRALTDPLSVKGRKPDVISASLGSCEADTQAAIGSAGVQTVESTLQLAAATGVSVLASSGDDGSTACLTNKGNPLDMLAVSFPASSPWVTGVGGTNIKLSADNLIADPATDQVVWNDEPALTGAGGGGLSTFAKPSYQDGFDPTGRREVPDVSMLADPLPGYEVFCSAKPGCVKNPNTSPWMTVGGTSAGTPLLAGGFALIDQGLREHGQQDLGFANPLLYKVAASPTAAATLSDVLVGSNDLSGTVFGHALGCCTAAAGYDPASGLGSVNVGGLANAANALVPQRVSVGLALPPQARPLRAQHLLATVSCTDECLMGAFAKIRIGSTTTTAFSQTHELTVRRRQTIKIALDGALRQRIRDSLGKHRPVTATVFGAIVDASGAVETQTPGKQLRITG